MSKPFDIVIPQIPNLISEDPSIVTPRTSHFPHDTPDARSIEQVFLSKDSDLPSPDAQPELETIMKKVPREDEEVVTISRPRTPLSLDTQAMLKKMPNLVSEDPSVVSPVNTRYPNIKS